LGSLGIAASAVALGAAAPDGASVEPAEALRRLEAGNRRYVAGALDPKDFTTGRAARAAGQAPFAALLCCSDSRVAPELIFDCHPGEVFVVRNAGNCVEPFGVASMEYATTALGVRLIVVVGHSGCGAVKAAIETVETGSDAPGHLPALVNDIRPSIEAVRGAGKGAPPAEAVIRAHVLRGVAELRANQPVLAGRARDGRLQVAGGVYDIASGRVVLV
jgi:carbonic anhydrase